MEHDPVPSPLIKSPPWIMKSLIWAGQRRFWCLEMDSRRWVTSGPCMPTYHAMELAVLVALRPPLCVLALARAELPEILCCAWRDVGEELHLDSA
jgi:hypothetical protein